MRIALVGGAGFIGHHAALSLKSRNHEVIAIDSLMVNNLYPHSISEVHHRSTAMLYERLALLEHAGVPLYVVDARDYHVLSRVLSLWNPDVIVHLAAVAHIDRANKDPWHTFDHSLRTLENSLDAARALDCALVYFSSSTVYGDFSAPVIGEDEPLTPFGVYGNLKLAGECMARAYNQTYGLPVTIVRPQALYGPRCVSGRVTQVFIERAMEGKPLTIMGDGDAKHDFTCIHDLVHGLRLILEARQPGLHIYNVTGECATSLVDLAAIVAEFFPTSIEYAAADSDKPARGTMSCQRICSELGYMSGHGIRHGMSEYMRWYEGFDRQVKAA